MELKNLLTCVSFLLFTTAIHAQQIRDIINSGSTYDKIVTDADKYFKDKYPDTPFERLSIGEHRDGDFVKYQRWKSYWESSLTPDGKLGDPSAYWRSKQNNNQDRSAVSPYHNVQWNNISYEFYIDTQIGLGRTTSIGFHPTDANTFYVGAAIGGIWKTTNGGQSYTPLGDDLPFMAVSSIVVDANNPNTIYIAISDHVWYGPQGLGVYKSTDGGQNWSPTSLSFSFQDFVRIYWMEAAPDDPNKMMVATTAGVYMTTDGFNSVNNVLSTDARDVKFHRTNPNLVFVGNNAGQFYRSTNGGFSFNNVANFGAGDVRIAVSYSNAQKVYARSGTTLHKSLDQGANFNSTSNLPENNTVFTFALNNDNTIVTGNFENYHSYNDGNNFTQNCSWLGNNGLQLVHVDQRNIFLNPLQSDYVYFCNDGGVYRYIISSNSYQNLCEGLIITQFYDIAVSQSDPNVIGAGSQDNGNVYRSSNGAWNDYASTGDGMNQEIDPNNANIRYWAYQNGAIRRWQNGSNTTISPPGLDGLGDWETPYKLDPNNSNRIIAGYKQVYASDNQGNDWYSISSSLNGNNINEIAIAPSNSNRIYATQNATLFVKNTNNNSWSSKSTPVNGRIADLEVDPENMNVVYIVYSGYQSGKVFRSSDAGDSWQNITGALPAVSINSIETYNDEPGGLFVGTDAGVFYKDDSTPEWLEYGKLPHTRVDDIEIQYSQQLIRVGTHGRGVFEADIDIMVNCTEGLACDDGNPCTLNDVLDAACQCAGQNYLSPFANDLERCGPGNVMLNASANYNGNIAWYDAPQGGSLLGQGNNLSINVNTNSNFYAEEILNTNTVFGGAANNNIGNGGNYASSRALVFDVINECVLKTVKVYAGSSGNRRVIVKNSNGVETHAKVINLSAGEQIINLDFELSPGSNYEITADEDYLIDMYRNSSGPSYPYNISNFISIKKSTANPGDEFDYYYFYYNWEVQSIACNSLPRTEVLVTVQQPGTACDDGDVCTAGDVLDAQCNCTGGTLLDSDNDGVCDVDDVCPNFDDTLIGTSCEDGISCTTGETYDTNCNCTGGSIEDSDNDGVCDPEDLCNGFDDNLIGTACDDGDSCTRDDVYDDSCNCVGTVISFINEIDNQLIDESLSVDQYIRTNGIVASGDIEYRAGEYILMMQGFEVKQGAVYHAFIAPCFD